jgi:AraC-like DNA-binding protein
MNTSFYLKKIIVFFHSVIVFYSLVASIFYYLLDNKIYFLVYLIFLIFNFFIILIIQKLSFEQIIPLIKSYLIITSTLIIFNTFSNILENPVFIIWSFLVLFMVYILYDKKTLIKWCLFFCLCIFVSNTLLYFSSFKSIVYKYSFVDTNSIYYKILNGISIITIILFFCLVFYFNNHYGIYLKRINIKNKKNIKRNINIENTQSENRKEKNESLEIDKSLEIIDYANDLNKINELYSKILIELKEKKLFLDKNLSIKSLALILKTNTSYISKAINLSTSDNFNNIVNLYRIEYFKELVKNNENKNYKLHHLYSEAGFNSQSTFYKAFKKIEKKSPLEYISEMHSLDL